MIIEAARAAMRNLLARELRSVFLKAFGLTLLALAALWFGLKELFDWLALPWLDAILPGLPVLGRLAGLSSPRSSPASGWRSRWRCWWRR